MKNKKILFLFLLSIFFVLSPYKVNADSGFDSDYSSSGSGSYSRSDYDHYSFSSGSRSYESKIYEEEPLQYKIIELTVAIVCLSIIGLFIKKKIIKMNYYYKNVDKRLAKEEKELINKIKKNLGDISIEEMKELTYEKYREIQLAWMNFDYDTLENCCTKTLYDKYYLQLEKAKKNNQRNIMKDFVLEDIDIENCEREGANIVIDVFMFIKCYDYIVDSSGNIIKGKDNIKINYEYEMTFIKNSKGLFLDKKRIFEQYYDENT